jgi:hypothetical protein
MMSTRTQDEVTSTLCEQLITKYNSTIPSVTFYHSLSKILMCNEMQATNHQ